MQYVATYLNLPVYCSASFHSSTWAFVTVFLVTQERHVSSSECVHHRHYHEFLHGFAGLAAAGTELQEAAVEASQAVEEQVQAAQAGMGNGHKKVEGSVSNLDVKGDMLEPSLANNKWVRSLYAQCMGFSK
jgi:hypothetical protein